MGVSVSVPHLIFNDSSGASGFATAMNYAQIDFFF